MILTHEGAFLVIPNLLGIFLNPFDSLGMFPRLLVLFNWLRVFLSFGCLCNIPITLWSTRDILDFLLHFPYVGAYWGYSKIFFWLNYM